MTKKTKDNEILSFEEFTARDQYGIIRYNNIIAFWFTGKSMISKYYRETEHARRFQREHPELDQRLCEDMKPAITPTNLPVKKRLYSAYKIMRSYGLSDEQLFT